MSQLKELLDHEASRVHADPSALDAVYRSGARRQRVRRIATIATALTIFAAVVIAFLGSLGSSRSSSERSPAASARLAGDIVVRAMIGQHEGAILDIDPATSEETALPVVASTEDLVWPPMGTGHGTDVSSSPDGTALAYVWSNDIWVLDIRSGRSVKLVNGCGDDCAVAWSPDGSVIAFTHADTLEVVTPGGTDRRTLTNLRGIRVSAWSPDGQSILASSGEQLYTMASDGSNVRSLGVRAWGAAWSPDGSRVAYVFPTDCDDQGECVVAVGTADSDGAARTVLTRTGTCFCLGFWPGIAWSPDGSELALVVPGLGDQPGGLYLVNADGTGLRLLREGAWGRPAWRPAT